MTKPIALMEAKIPQQRLEKAKARGIVVYSRFPAPKMSWSERVWECVKFRNFAG